jgi:hypothetical protein
MKERIEKPKLFKKNYREKFRLVGQGQGLENINMNCRVQTLVISIIYFKGEISSC